MKVSEKFVRIVCFIFILGLGSNIIAFYSSRPQVVQFEKTLEAYAEVEVFDLGLEIILPQIVTIIIFSDNYNETKKSFFVTFSPFLYDLPPPHLLS